VIVRRKYNALVSVNQDPEQLGRIKVRCGEIAPGELPFWVKPALSSTSKGSGFFLVPDVDSYIVIEVSANVSEGRCVVLTAAPEAVYFPAPWLPSNPVPADFVTNYPRRRGYMSGSGHVVIFDDTDGSESITIRHKQTSTYVLMSPDGNVTIHAPHVLIDKDADVHLVRGEDLRSYMNATMRVWALNHIHPTGVGPSGPPTTQYIELPTSALSANHKVK